MASEYENPADELAALMNGSLKIDSADLDDENEDADDAINNDGANNEDTDLDEGSDDDEELDTETNDLNDDDGDDTDEGSEDDLDNEEEGNAQVEDGNLDGEGESDDESDESKANGVKTDDADEETETANNKDTEDLGDGEGSDTKVVDYKKQYEELLQSNNKLQSFYDEVTSEFTANGKKMKGFTDPKKIIQSQQMAAGFSEKMSAFKPYRPFMDTIKKQGWIEDPAKFDMAVNLMNGDTEAIKKLIKDSNIDLVDMDLDNINYNGEKHTSSNSELVLDDMFESAKIAGVNEELSNVLGGKWSDDGSLVELLQNPEDAQALTRHLIKDETGVSAYDDIQERISEKLRTDFNGQFTGKNSIQQYKIAAAELQSEYLASIKSDKMNKMKEEHAARIKAERVNEEKAKIAAKRQEAEYKAKMNKNTKKVSDARKKAANLSAPKKKTKTSVKFDPVDKSHTLEGDELMDYFNKSILGKNY